MRRTIEKSYREKRKILQNRKWTAICRDGCPNRQSYLSLNFCILWYRFKKRRFFRPAWNRELTAHGLWYCLKLIYIVAGGRQGRFSENIIQTETLRTDETHQAEAPTGKDDSYCGKCTEPFLWHGMIFF